MAFVIEDKDAFLDEFGRGLEERDYSRNPVGYCSQPFTLDLIPRSEWKDRLQAIKANPATTLSAKIKREGIRSLNQGRTNYCWAYSSLMAAMLRMVQAGQKYVPLSGTSIAVKIKNYRNQGGWCTQSLEYIAQHGACRLADWPEGPEGIRRDLDSPMVWETAKQFRVTEWMDLEPGNVDQLVTCLLSGIPVASEFNWWGHAVCSIDLEDIEVRGSRITNIDTRIKNSWGENWGENGEGILKGNKAIPNGAIAPFVAMGA